MGQDTVISTRGGKLKRLYGTSILTNASVILNPADVLDRPVAGLNTGIIDLGNGVHDGNMPNGLLIHPTGTATNAFLMSIFLIDQIVPHSSVSGSRISYHYSLLAALVCTPGTTTGVAGGSMDASQLYCSTITIGAGNPSVSVEVLSPGTSGTYANNAGSVRCDNLGGALIYIAFDRNGATNQCNCLYRPF